MGTHNEWRAEINVPADKVAPLAKALREHRSEWGKGDEKLNDNELIVRALLDAEGDENSWYRGGVEGVESHMYTDADEEGLVIHCDSAGKMGDADTVERLFAAHSAEGTIDGEAEGNRYRVRIKNGERREYEGDVIFPDDPEEGAVGKVWSLSVYDGGSITTTLHPTEDAAEASLRANFDQEPSDYAALPLDELIESLERRDGISVAIEKHVLG